MRLNLKFLAPIMIGILSSPFVFASKNELKNEMLAIIKDAKEPWNIKGDDQINIGISIELWYEKEKLSFGCFSKFHSLLVDSSGRWHRYENLVSFKDCEVAMSSDYGVTMDGDKITGIEAMIKFRSHRFTCSLDKINCSKFDGLKFENITSIGVSKNYLNFSVRIDHPYESCSVIISNSGAVTHLTCNAGERDVFEPRGKT